MRIRRPLVTVVPAATIAAALCLLSAAPAGAAAPIEGSWHYGGGQVLVEPIGPNRFKGTVIKPTTFSQCTHPTGQRMWEIYGSGASYAGTHVYFHFLGCSDFPGGLATWTIREDPSRFLLDFCSAEPGKGSPTPDNPSTKCHTLARAKAPPDRTQACATGKEVCMDGPSDLKTIGCLRRIRIPHRFRLKLKSRGGRSVIRRARARQVAFVLDGRAVGTDRRRPFEISLSGELLTPGAHVLKAKVKLRVARSKQRRGTRQLTRKLTYRFNACEAG